MRMHDQYKGRFEKEFWLRKIYILIVNINEISNSNIDLDNEMNIYRSKDEDYCIVTYLYYRLCNISMGIYRRTLLLLAKK